MIGRPPRTDWTTVDDDDLLARLGTALTPAPAPKVDAVNGAAVPLRPVGSTEGARRPWQRPLAWAAAAVVVAGVAAGIAASGGGSDRVGTTPPAGDGPLTVDPDLIAATTAADALELALSNGDAESVATAATALRTALDVLDPAARAQLGDRPRELLEAADALLATTTTSSTSSTPGSVPGTSGEPGDATTPSTTIDDHGGDDGEDNSGPGSGDSGSGSDDDVSRSGSDDDGSSESGSDDSGSDD